MSQAKESPMNTSEPTWEMHADWWIDGFTGGVDPEY